MPIMNHRRIGEHGRKNRVRGVSLLEVLVSILLSAVGLLALAGANVASIRYAKMSQYRGTATMLAADLAERMRANRDGFVNYAYGSDFAAQGTDPVADTACNYYPANCAAAAMAAYDLANWRVVVRSQLPEGSVFVVIPFNLEYGADVWLAWKDPAVATPGENSTDARNTVLECPADLNAGADKSIRCSYFRINI